VVIGESKLSRARASHAMFTPDVPAYAIDLDQPEASRWAEVIASERPVAERLIREASAAFERLPELVRWGFARLYQALGGLYCGELRAWADGLGLSIGTVTILNCAYELSHLRWPKVFGCTAGVRWVEGLGMVHVRNLDWPLRTLGPATRLFRFRRGPREFVSIGVPGQVGILSGMVPGAYSVTINWAPPVSFPSFDFGPTFLLRDTLETCDSYDAAVRALAATPLSTSAFFTICGSAKDQACVIERTQRDAAVRPLAGPVLVQANHHVADAFARHNEDLHDVAEGEEEFSMEGSCGRAHTLSERLAALETAATLEEAAAVLNVADVLNRHTCQQMAFCPGRGEVRVWRRREE
jgi:hypothetical protein